MFLLPKLLGILLLSVVARIGGAQDQPPIPPEISSVGQPAAELKPDDIEELKKRLEGVTDVSEDQKRTVQESIQRATDQLKMATDEKANKARFESQIATVEKDRQEKLTRLQSLKSEILPQPSDEEEIPVLEQQLANKQQELLLEQTELEKVEKQIAGREDRRKVIRDRLTKIPTEQETATQQLAQLKAVETPTLETDAKRAALQAELQKLEAEPLSLQTEANYLVAQETAKLLQTERQLRADKVSRLKQQIENWQQKIEVRKWEDSKSRRGEAERKAQEEEIPEVKAIYKEILGLIDDEQSVRQKTVLVNDDIRTAQELTEFVDEELKQIKDREDEVGTSTSFGIRLRDQRRKLPDPRDLEARIRKRSEDYENAQLKVLNLREDRRDLDDLEAEVQKTIGKIQGIGGSDEDRNEVERKVTAAVERKQDNLDRLLNAYQEYTQSLTTLSDEQLSLARESRAFREYIDERVLWVPSHAPLSWSDTVSDVESLKRLIDREFWEAVGKTFLLDATRHAFLYLIGILTWVVLFLTQARQRSAIQNWGKKATSRLNTSFAPTSSALLWTVVRASVLPFPFLFLGWRAYASQSPGTGYAIGAFGRNEVVVALTVGCLEFIRVVCRGNGLGISHFQWPKRVNDLVSSTISSFLTIATPLALVIALLRARSQPEETQAFERVLMIAINLLLAGVMYRLTVPKTGLLKEWIEAHPSGWLAKLSGLIHWVAVAVPLILAVLTVVGYTYAAEHLSMKLTQAVFLIFGVVFARALIIRWLMLRQRRLAIEQARELRAAMAQSDRERDVNLQDAQEARTNLAEVSAQSKRLVNSLAVIGTFVGLGLIWIEVLPAIRYFDEYTIPNTEIKASAVALAVFLLMLTTTAARNVPGLVEILLLERLPIDRSARYAIQALTRYAIVLLGATLIGWELNIEWKDLQWLAAALTFGLGFGLQEIFANFVSGLIILFEQPVRVGDIVTIDGTTGTVSRIRMRSTTITDWDRKDYVVPNKEFITGRLLNWTLSDTMTRVKIEVGVTYDADPKDVHRILTETVVTQEHVLEEPPPIVFFESFGDSSLNFTMFAFLPALEHRLPTIHALNSRIHEALGKAGIEIPYPQRDLHIRSSIDVPIARRNRRHNPEVPSPEEIVEAID